jgi:hypothetical protein
MSSTECTDADQADRNRNDESESGQRRKWRDIDWNEIMQGNGTASRIFMRSGLIRKDLIGQFGQHHCPRTLCLAGKSPEEIQAWCAEVVESLDQDFDSSEHDSSHDFCKHWYVLKFAASSNAHGIRFIDASSRAGIEAAASYSAAQSGRAAIIQKYVAPMLIDGKKFHVRCLVLCVGALDVFMYEDLRVLLAPVRLDPSTPIDEADLHAHVTNRSFNADHRLYNEQHCNLAFTEAFVDDTRKELLRQIRGIIRHLFRQLCSSRRHFFPLPNCYEVFGLDFCVDASGRVWLLEANPDPVLALHGTTFGQLLPSCPFEHCPPPNFELVHSANATTNIA